MFKFRKIRPISQAWGYLLPITFLSAYLYIFLEWLFIVTKPSFMDLFGLAQKLEIALFAASSLAFVSLLVLVIPWALNRHPELKRYSQFWVRLGTVVPALLLGALAMLLIDNFTYTVFKYGIVISHGVARGLYALIFTGLTVYIYFKLIHLVYTLVARKVPATIRRRTTVTLAALLLIGIGIPLAGGKLTGETSALAGSGGELKNPPHILLITIDGVDANNMSLYGAVRDTTPRLRGLASSLLVAENAFPNGNVTATSIVSIYTGKYPSQTRFFYPPNILLGDNAYQHLPGILHSLGYRTIEIASPHYVDAVTFNMLNAFDVSNGRTLATNTVVATLNKYMASDFAYFFYEIGSRLIDRLGHIFYLKTMADPFKMVTNAKSYNDTEKIDQILDTLTNASQPVFIHAHLMGTHGDKFLPSRQVFSVGQSLETQEPWNLDLYDDAILDFDKQMGQIVDTLAKRGLLDQTIIVIASDHGIMWTDTQRIPLIFRFPDAYPNGTIRTNVQNLDIAPTLLDYLDVSQPTWMKGTSLLTLNPPHRPIISVGPSPSVRGDEGWTLDLSQIRPPFYDLGRITLISCQKWYRLDFYAEEWTSGDIEKSTATCSENETLTAKGALQVMIDHLRQNGYDTSTIQDFPVK
jgi:hypothetical protein